MSDKHEEFEEGGQVHYGNCQRCLGIFRHPPGSTPMLRMLKPLCAKCEQIQTEEEREKRGRERREELEQLQRDNWAAVCPPNYRDTDLSHNGLLPAFREAALAWTYSPTGLGFMGTTGAGKTRTLFMALRRTLFEENRSVAAISHNAFSKLVIQSFTTKVDDSPRYDAIGRRLRISPPTLESLAKVDVLLLDDLGKAPSTERVDAELEELVERRTSHKLPILWSANGRGAWLENRFGPDRGGPLVRRLCEFSKLVTYTT